jgi:hypothetical protein
MKNPIKTRRAAIATLAAVATVGVATAAWAVFSAQSTANAGGTSANIVALTIDGTEVDYAGEETMLWPNVDSNGANPADPSTGTHLATVKVTVVNPNEVALKVSEADIIGTLNFTNGTDQANCGGYLLKTTPVTLVSGPVTIGKANPFNDTDKATLSLQHIYLRGDAPNACINKPFTSTWTITGNAL